ncbi:MAG TPA: hypothetical protein VF662_08740 [Allosphingosinicella sp.]|jgi:hypothetical protein
MKSPRERVAGRLAPPPPTANYDPTVSASAELSHRVAPAGALADGVEKHWS